MSETSFTSVLAILYQADTWGWEQAQAPSDCQRVGAQPAKEVGRRGRTWQAKVARFTITVWSFTLQAFLLRPNTFGVVAAKL